MGRRRSDMTLAQAELHAMTLSLSTESDEELEKLMEEAKSEYSWFDWFLTVDPDNPDRKVIRVIALPDE